jgi:cyclopropane fatty-acyl-phospholipid synthase-like methyltransferase
MSHPDAEAFWSGRYAEVGDDYLFGTAPTRFMTRAARWLSPGMSALSVADGEGRNSVFLAQEGLAVTAVELSPVAQHKARRLADAHHVDVDFVLADILKWDWPTAAFDAVVAIFIQFLAPAERDSAFGKLVDALKPGGLLLLHGYTPKQLEYRTGGPSAVENLYTADILRAAFAGLEILELREYEEVLEEGVGHKGRSALIDLVARKPER